MSLQKLITLFGMSLLGLALALFLGGCPPDEGDDDDVSDDDVADDDVADDDVSDDDVSDDDVSDDDVSDDDTGSDAPGGYYFDASFSFTGGEGPGDATLDMMQIMVDDPQATSPTQLCAYTYQFVGTYPAIAPSQGDDYYPYMDLVATFDTTTLAESSCPAEWDDQYAAVSDLDNWFQWFVDPAGFITCDIVAQIPNLAATQLMDDFIGAGLTDGTLGSWCTEYAALVQQSGYNLDGVWVRPMNTTEGDYGVGLEYYPAQNGDVGGAGYYDAWAFFGFMYGDTTNTYEPAAGVEGDYITDIFWVWTVSP